MRKNTYLFVQLKIRNGEYEYYSQAVHEVDRSIADIFAQLKAKEFYGGEPDAEDGGYYFHGGEVHVSVSRSSVITEAEYNVLKKYI